MHGRVGLPQWRNKVAVGPRASIPKGPPLPPKKKLLKTASGKLWAPHSAGPACTARLARPIVTPLVSRLRNVATWQYGEQQRNSATSLNLLTYLLTKKRSFHIAAPAIWDTLPDHTRSPSISKGQFRCGLKTHLYQQTYNL